MRTRYICKCIANVSCLFLLNDRKDRHKRKEDLMSDNELLLAIADIVGRNTKALEHRIDRVENSLNKRIDGVDARVRNIEMGVPK